jgi:hypothetical protein
VDCTEITPQDVIAAMSLLIGRAGRNTTLVGGTIGFRVHGEGSGTWVVNLDVSGGDWAGADEASLEKCHTRVYAFASVFPAIVMKPDDIEGLLASGEIVVEGDTRKLGRLARIIDDGASALASRLRTTITRNTPHEQHQVQP